MLSVVLVKSLMITGTWTDILKLIAVNVKQDEIEERERGREKRSQTTRDVAVDGEAARDEDVRVRVFADIDDVSVSVCMLSSLYHMITTLATEIVMMLLTEVPLLASALSKRAGLERKKDAMHTLRL